jgi:hypothetical protein
LQGIQKSNKNSSRHWEANKNALQVACNCTRVRSVTRIIRSVGWCYRATVVRMRLRGEGMAGTDPRRRPLSQLSRGSVERRRRPETPRRTSGPMPCEITSGTYFAVPLAFAGPVRPCRRCSGSARATVPCCAVARDTMSAAGGAGRAARVRRRRTCVAASSSLSCMTVCTKANLALLRTCLVECTRTYLGSFSVCCVHRGL